MSGNMAVVFAAKGEVEFREMDMPAPGEGQVLVKTEVSQISTGTELSMLLKDVPEGSVWDRISQYPRQVGYSNVGRVEAVGEGLDAASWVGKRIFTHCNHAAYVVADACGSHVAVVPDDVSSDAAVFAAIARIAMNGVRRGQTRWGDAVVVYGAGLIGQHTALYARLCGAMPVFVVDVSDFRLGKLPDDPCIIPINGEREDPVEVVKAHTYKERMADIVFETTGSSRLIPSEFSVLRKQGRFVVVSSPRGKTEFDFHDLCNSPSFTIIGAHNGSHPSCETPDNPWTMARDGAFHHELIQSGQYDPLPMVSHRFPCGEAVEAYRMLVEDRTQALAVHLDWTGAEA